MFYTFLKYLCHQSDKFHSSFPHCYRPHQGNGFAHLFLHIIHPARTIIVQLPIVIHDVGAIIKTAPLITSEALTFKHITPTMAIMYDPDQELHYRVFDKERSTTLPVLTSLPLLQYVCHCTVFHNIDNCSFAILAKIETMTQYISTQPLHK